MAAIDTSNTFDWAHDAFVALNKDQSDDNWSPFTNSSHALHGLAFSIPPSLLTQASIERFGQITPPEELSPTAAQLEPASHAATPGDHIRNEVAWSSDTAQQKIDSNPTPPLEEVALKRRRLSKHSANQSRTAPQQDTSINPQPPKRKRGRPKSQPQMVEAFTADGFPFQVSSARQSHLEKNRVAAHKCRQRKKEYINGLEGRARDYSSKNKALKENVAMLREEVLALKNEVLRHAGCGFWAVDEYLARCAGDLLGMEAPHTLSSPSTSSRSPAMSMGQLQDTDMASLVSSPDMDDFGGLELLRDFDEADMDTVDPLMT